MKIQTRLKQSFLPDTARNKTPSLRIKYPVKTTRFGDIIDFESHSHKQDPCLVVNQVHNLLCSIKTLNDIKFDRKAMDKLLESAINQLKLVKDEVSLDSLTGAYNRASIDRFMKQGLKIAYQTKQPFTVAVMDIDDLKPVNVQHGTLAASLVIRDVVHAALQKLGKKGKICLYGGDEFVIFIPGLTWPTAKRLLVDIKDAVSQIHLLKTNDPLRQRVYRQKPVHVSLGAVALRTGQLGMDILEDNHLRIFNLAAEGLKAAKSLGKNQVRGIEITPAIAADQEKPQFNQLI